jgi:hypothetical protein
MLEKINACACQMGVGFKRDDAQGVVLMVAAALTAGKGLRAAAIRALETNTGPPTCNGNPLVDVRTGAGHADVRLGGLWNRHVWKKDTRARAGRFIKYQNR